MHVNMIDCFVGITLKKALGSFCKDLFDSFVKCIRRHFRGCVAVRLSFFSRICCLVGFGNML